MERHILTATDRGQVTLLVFVLAYLSKQSYLSVDNAALVSARVEFGMIDLKR